MLVRLKAIRPGLRKLWGTLLLAGSAALLLGGLLTLAKTNPTGNLYGWQWVAVAVLGLLFVYCQSMAAAMLVSLGEFGVTGTESASSTSSNLEGK